MIFEDVRAVYEVVGKREVRESEFYSNLKSSYPKSIERHEAQHL